MGKQTPRIQMSVFFERHCHGNCLESCKVVIIHWWVYATGRQEEKDGKTLVCDKRDRATTK